MYGRRNSMGSRGDPNGPPSSGGPGAGGPMGSVMNMGMGFDAGGPQGRRSRDATPQGRDGRAAGMPPGQREVCELSSVPHACPHLALQHVNTPNLKVWRLRIRSPHNPVHACRQAQMSRGVPMHPPRLAFLGPCALSIPPPPLALCLPARPSALGRTTPSRKRETAGHPVATHLGNTSQAVHGCCRCHHSRQPPQAGQLSRRGPCPLETPRCVA
jgi:hypothetical protein